MFACFACMQSAYLHASCLCVVYMHGLCACGLRMCVPSAPRVCLLCLGAGWGTWGRLRVVYGDMCDAMWNMM